MVEPPAPPNAAEPDDRPPRTLVLMRHAAAGGAARDHDRPLTPDGVAAATAAGRWMREHLPPVDLAICSTARRTRETLSAAGVAADARFSDELYGGGVDDILDQIATAPGHVRTLLVVGHAPTIPSTAWELVTEARLDADEPAGPASDPTVEPDPDPADDELRSFSAGTFAVLTTPAAWADLGQVGARLRAVQHPR